MTGPWEQRLRNLAEGGTAWDLPAREQLLARLLELRYVLDKVASEPGLAGMSGDAATASFATASRDAARQIDYLETELPRAIGQANIERARAQGYLDRLGGGRLSPGQEAMVRGAAIGTTIVLGPLSILAGEGAVQAFNWFLGNQREDEARKAVETVSGNLDAMTLPAPPTPEGTTLSFTEPGADAVPAGPIAVGRPARMPSMQSYPDADLRPIDRSLPSGIDPAIIRQTPLSPTPTYPPATGPGVIDLAPVPPDDAPTPDGPTGGVSTLPIGGSVPGGATLPGGGSAGIGSGLGAGLAAGAGGAAALARLGGGGSVGAGGAASIGGAGGRGGMAAGLGGRGAATGLGARIGGATTGGVVGGGAGARGGTGAGGAGAGAAAGGRAGTGASGGGLAGGGAGGRGGDRTKERPHGLGGPIAERLDDDDDIAPRSENAGAGGRD